MNDLKYKNYEGCRDCELVGLNINCKKLHVPVTITFNKVEKSDCWGRMVTVFRAGESVKGDAVIKDNTVYCASAESNIYEGYYDYVDTKNIKVESI